MRHRWASTPRGSRCERCGLLMIGRKRPSKNPRAVCRAVHYVAYLPKGFKVADAFESARTPSCPCTTIPF
jgi:hypothetical protein